MPTITGETAPAAERDRLPLNGQGVPEPYPKHARVSIELVVDGRRILYATFSGARDEALTAARHELLRQSVRS